MKVRGKKVATIVGAVVILGVMTVGCSEKEMVAETEKVVPEVIEMVEVTEMAETKETSEDKKTIELDSGMVVEEVTLDMLNTRLEELVKKYEGTLFIEPDIKKDLAEANHSFMSEETLFRFLEITSYEELEPFAYGEELYNYSMSNIEKKIENLEYELVIFDVGDLFFNETLIEMGNFITERILDVESGDQEKSMKAARELVYYYGKCKPEGVTVEKAPILRDDEILDSSAGIYINAFYGYSIAIFCREEIELEQPDSMELICGMWGNYDQKYEFYYLLAEKGIVELYSNFNCE